MFKQPSNLTKDSPTPTTEIQTLTAAADEPNSLEREVPDSGTPQIIDELMVRNADGEEPSQRQTSGRGKGMGRGQGRGRSLGGRSKVGKGKGNKSELGNQHQSAGSSEPGKVASSEPARSRPQRTRVPTAKLRDSAV